MEWVLMVTWFFATSVSSYTTEFATDELCWKAAGRLVEDGIRIGEKKDGVQLRVFLSVNCVKRK
jgi:hypothetical protein